MKKGTSRGVEKATRSPAESRNSLDNGNEFEFWNVRNRRFFERFAKGIAIIGQDIYGNICIFFFFHFITFFGKGMVVIEIYWDQISI